MNSSPDPTLQGTRHERRAFELTRWAVEENLKGKGHRLSAGHLYGDAALPGRRTKTGRRRARSRVRPMPEPFGPRLMDGEEVMPYGLTV